MRAGNFSLDQKMSMHEIVDHLLYGETVKRRLTVPEGMSTKDVVALVARTDGLYGEVPRVVQKEFIFRRLIFLVMEIPGGLFCYEWKAQ